MFNDGEDAKKFGKCPVCKQDERWLLFAIGLLDGRIWSNFICKDCIDMLRNKEVKE